VLGVGDDAGAILEALVDADDGQAHAGQEQGRRHHPQGPQPLDGVADGREQDEQMISSIRLCWNAGPAFITLHARVQPMNTSTQRRIGGRAQLEEAQLDVEDVPAGRGEHEQVQHRQLLERREVLPAAGPA
jgi:hypothetical protein